MDDTQAPTLAATGIGTTALGRLQMRVPEEDGFEEVMVERRWPDMSSARAWCERSVERAPHGSLILEIQVFEESWRRARSWETTKSRPVAEALQLGVVNDHGDVRWSALRPMTPRAGSRHLL
ncbi:MAG: hypothetical protein JWQ67_2719 [Marmoricola sp.]|jgi:hypothetical protein|nr:hypothetical protein [Marmoricola sp.]MCW2820583.1 hypothetical protein [Marmoricola sp.]MCW2829103.1 hypothetical protein [Marmoricola sp.]